MIGLLVQLTSDFAKIWSVSSRRRITYSRDDLPSDCHEGDWIAIEFELTGVMKGMKKMKAELETRRDERGKMQVLDVFLVDSGREEAFSEAFGVVNIERAEGGERWTEDEKTKDHCFLLWMTISTNSQFSIEEQSLDRAFSKDGKYADRYRRMKEAFYGDKYTEPTAELSDECREFDETILIVGFDQKSSRFFSSSRCGEAFVNESLWIKFKGEEKMEKGTCFRARIQRIEDASDTMHRVVALYERVKLWDGVRVNLTAKDLNVELNAVVVERRKTCFAIDTEPFGLVTYPLDKSFLSTDIHIGDSLRVALYRYKNESRDDHPSKWQVTRLHEVVKRAEKKEINERIQCLRLRSKSDLDNQDPEAFSETILLVGYDERYGSFFSSSRCGEAVVPRSVWEKHGQVQLGDVFRATLQRVPDPGVEFEVLKLEKKVVWQGVVVNVCGNKDVRVELTGKIVERRRTCCALETVPFGLITYPLGRGVKSIPEDIQIGDHLSVRISRFKYESKSDHPSKWQVTSVKQRLLAPVGKGDWFEGIVTSISGTRVFISFKHGNALYYTNCNIDINLGSIVDICVSDTGRDSFFEVCDIDSRTRTREDIRVEKDEDKDRVIFTVTCPAEVVERRDGYFLLDTPIIGLAQFLFRECPKSMKVGDVWEVKMHRRKEKRDLPSHWVAHAVVGDSPRSTVTEKTSSKERKGGKEKNLSAVRSEDDRHWGTVIITGAKNGDWFASCYLADTVTIPYSLVRKLPVPKRGTFYRIKCSKENDRWKAYELNPDPVYPKNFEVVGDEESSLQVWCYARIKSSESTSFTLFNEILGEATLPHKFADREMRVGDDIEALYYRVKTSRNSTNWMVQKVAFPSNSKRDRDMARSYDKEDRGVKEARSDDHENQSGSHKRSDTKESPSRLDAELGKDRRVLDSTRYFLNLPSIRDLFNKDHPKELKMIEKILERDRIRSQQ